MIMVILKQKNSLVSNVFDDFLNQVLVPRSETIDAFVWKIIPPPPP